MIVDWPNKIVHVFISDLGAPVQTVPTTIYDMDLNWFRLTVKSLEDDVEGMPFLDVTNHNTEVSLGGLTYARVIEIINGYSITFEDGQYAVNLIGANSNVGDKINVNNVSVRSANSAGMISSPDIEYASFQSSVWIDAIGGNDEWKGNEQWPVKTVDGAMVVANYRGFKQIRLMSDITFGAGHIIDDFLIIGSSHVVTDVIIEEAADCQRLRLQNCKFSGVLDGDTEVFNCIVGDITYVNGHIHDSGLNGTIVLGGNKKAIIADCRTIDQDNPPHIDMGGTGQSLAMPNYSGIIHISNLSDDEQEIGIGLDAGLVEMEDTITAGNHFIAGTGICYDYSGGTAEINLDGLINKELIVKATWDKVYIDVVNGVSGTSRLTGTISYPSNNIIDAKAIAITNNITLFHVKGNLVLNTDVSGYLFQSNSSSSGSVDLNNQNITGCRFESITIFGDQNGRISARTCRINSLQNIEGSYTDCKLMVTTPLLVAEDGVVFMNNLRSGVAGGNSPVIDYQNGGIDMSCRAYSGGIKIINSTDSLNVSTYEFIAGKFNFDDSNTNGEFHVRGVIDTTGIDVTAGASVHYTGSVTTNRELEYGGKIYLCSSCSSTGSVYPYGLPGTPTNNISDALILAAEYNCSIIEFEGSITITTGQDISGLSIEAERSLGNSITVNSGAITAGTYFENITISGVMNGSVRYTTCVIGEITNFDGGAKNSLLTGNITFTGTNNNYLTECDTFVTSSDYISLYQNAASLNVIRGRGRLGIFNKTSTDYTAIDLVSGFVYVDSSCNTGEVRVGGIGSVEDNSGAGCTVRQGSINDIYIADAVLSANPDEYLPDSVGDALHDISYTEKYIYINTELGENGNGKSSHPFNNISDAVDFAESVGWFKLVFLSDATLERTLRNFTIEGIGLPTIDFNGQNVDRTEFIKVKLTGEQQGSITAREVLLLPGVSNLSGIYKECGIAANGTYTIAESAVVSLTSASTLLLSTNATPPIFDFGTSTTTGILSARKYSGGLELHNVNTTTKIATIQFDGGQVIIDSSCDNGIIKIAGIPDSAVTNNGTSTLEMKGILPSSETIVNDVWDEQTSEHTDAGTTGLALGTASSGGVDVNVLAAAVWNHADGNDVHQSVVGKALILPQGDDTKIVNVYDESGLIILYSFTVSADNNQRIPI